MRDILLTSSALILALLVLRRLFRRTLSRRVQYALWGLVLLRLLLPVNLPAADFSLLTAAKPVTNRVESLYVSPDRMTIGRTDGGYVWGIPRTPKVAVGPATPDNSRTFLDRDLRGNQVKITEEYKRQILLSDLLPPIWYGGMAMMACWLVLSNLLFWRKLRRTRIPYPTESSPCRVYLVERGLPSPCLFGLFRPAIYLTPAALSSPAALRHVLAHEETHARHLDPLWSLLRGVCLTVYWFDPLVWWAALASRTDCELACDEGALRRLGEEERIPYGRTLLSLVPVRRAPVNPLLSATTMTSGRRRLTDRISRIAENRRYLGTALFAAAALAALACAVTFTGAKGERPRLLTSEELDYFNGDFFTEPCAQGENRRRQFLTSLYDSPQSIDLYELLYNGTGLPEEITAGDRRYWKDLFEDSEPAAENCVKLSLPNIETFLLENTGCSLQDHLRDWRGGFWWNEEEAAYYNIFREGPELSYRDIRRHPEPVVFTSGEREGDLVRLYYEGTLYSESTGSQTWTQGPLCVTLRKKPGGGWLFVSNQWARSGPAHPDWEPLAVIPLDGLEPYEPEPAEALPFPEGGLEMLGGPKDPDHILGEYSLMFFRGGGGQVYAGVQRSVLSSWPPPFLALPGENYSVTWFQGLFGRDGFAIHCGSRALRTEDPPVYSGDPFTNYYYLNEDGQPVLLASVPGLDPLLEDLNGDGRRELASGGGLDTSGRLFFQRDGKLYQADLAALLEPLWPEDTLFSFGSWDAAGRSLSFRAWLYSFSSVAGDSRREYRTLYFDGDRLLIYNDQRQPESHMLDWFDLDGQLKENALDLVEKAFRAAGDGYDNWRITDIDSLGVWYFGGEEVRLCRAWKVGYELHAKAPAEGGPWVPAGPGYLYYEETSGESVFLYGEAENEFEPGSHRFWTAMVNRLYRMSGPLTALSGGELFQRFRTFEWTQELLDSLGALPSPDRETVLDTLAGELNTRGEASWRTTRSFLRAAALSPQGQKAWEALQTRIVTPSAPEAAQTALEEIMSGNRVNLTLLGETGNIRRDADPHAGTGPDRLLGFTRDYEWSYAEDPGDVPAASLLVISPGGNVSFRFWPGSDLALLSRWQEELWFRAVPRAGEPDGQSIFDFMCAWYVEAEGIGVSGETP